MPKQISIETEGSRTPSELRPVEASQRSLGLHHEGSGGSGELLHAA